MFISKATLLALSMILFGACDTGKKKTETDTESVTDTDTGSDTDTGTDADTDTDTDTDMATDTDADSDTGTDVESEADCLEYVMDDANYIYQVSFQRADEIVGFDWDSDQELDNTWGKTFTAMVAMNEDLEGFYDDIVQQGDLCRVIEFRSDPLDAETPTRLRLFECLDEDGYEDNTSGTETFGIKVASFVEREGKCIQQAVSEFTEVSLSDAGELTASAAHPVHFVTVDFTVFGSAAMPIELHGARLKGNLTNDTGGTLLVDGVLGGYFLAAEYFDVLSDRITANCSCLGLMGQPYIEYVADMSQPPSCADFSDSTCDSMIPEEESCQNVADYCDVSLLLLKPDIDADGNGTKESFSFAVALETIVAFSAGVSQE